MRVNLENQRPGGDLPGCGRRGRASALARLALSLRLERGPELGHRVAAVSKMLLDRK
jgi:hypothetical protein